MLRERTAKASECATTLRQKTAAQSPSATARTSLPDQSLQPLRDPESLLIVVSFTLSIFYQTAGMLGARNRIGLTEHQIEHCQETWEFLCGRAKRELDPSEAHRHGSRTRYDERRRAVILGADAYPGTGQSANSRMSVLACLAHELAHMRRAARGFRRPLAPPGGFLDEAETSIYASFFKYVPLRDREDLVEDARDRLFDWLAFPKE